MAVYRLTVEYDGTGWHGWQKQPGAPTIQESLESALATALRTRIPIVGSGRTDAGVHALGQVAHFEFEEAIDPHRLLGQLNGLLPRSVSVRSLEEAPADFHARYGAVLRTYRYKASVLPVSLERSTRIFLFHKPDFDAMNRAAALLCGRHNFSSFCRTASQTTNRVCRIDRASWEAASVAGHWDFVISGDRFLHGMVRAIVGTLLEIGAGTRQPEDLSAILEARDRTEAGPAAPARGLMLEAVDY